MQSPQPDTLSTQSPQQPSSLAPAPSTSSPNSSAINPCPSILAPLPMANMSLDLPNAWQNIVTGNVNQAQVADLVISKTLTINYQSLGLIYTAEDLAKNKHQLNMTNVPNAILQMAYNKVYIPLMMLTTATLTKICSNDTLKYQKIPWHWSVHLCISFPQLQFCVYMYFCSTGGPHHFVLLLCSIDIIH